MNQDYEAANSGIVDQIADLALEVQLFNSPVISVQTDGALQTPSILVDEQGQSFDAPESELSVYGASLYSQAKIRLIGLKGLSMMQLIAATSEQRKSEKKFTNEMASIQKTFEDGTYKDSYFTFTNTETAETIELSISRIESLGKIASASAVSLEINDGMIRKKLEVDTYPSSYDGQTIRRINQSVGPSDDLLLFEVKQFARETDERALALFTIPVLFMTDPPRAETEILRITASFHEEELRGRLDAIAENLRAGVINRKSAVELSRQTPSVNMPSVDELLEYKNLLSDLCA